MRKLEMSKVMQTVLRMTAVQRAALMLALQGVKRSDEVAVLVDSRLQGAGARCPHCQCQRLVRNGHASGLQRFKCRGCARTFNALTSTPMARLRMKDKWPDQQEVLRQGLSVSKAAGTLGVSPSTAFRWRHRFLQQAQPVKASDLVGVVEADETYFLRSSKGQKVVGRKSRKRGGKASKRGLSDEQLPVLVVRDRSGATADFILPAASKITLAAALEPIVHKDAVLCTDGSPAMAAAAHQLGIQHEAVNLAQGIRIRGPWHIQNANAYRGRLKNWLRRFQGVAISYLGSRLAWFRALDRASKTGSMPFHVERDVTRRGTCARLNVAWLARTARPAGE